MDISIKGKAHPLFQFCPFTIQPNGIGGCWRLGSTHSLYSLLTPFLEFHTVEVCCWFNTKKNQLLRKSNLSATCSKNLPPGQQPRPCGSHSYCKVVYSWLESYTELPVPWQVPWGHVFLLLLFTAVEHWLKKKKKKTLLWAEFILSVRLTKTLWTTTCHQRPQWHRKLILNGQDFSFDRTVLSAGFPIIAHLNCRMYRLCILCESRAPSDNALLHCALVCFLKLSYHCKTAPQDSEFTTSTRSWQLICSTRRWIIEMFQY